MRTLLRALTAAALATICLGAISERVREPQGVTDTEIRIGNLMPYSGSLKVFGEIGKAEAAYFDTINERGGINGRKVRFISYDDKSSPATALKYCLLSPTSVTVAIGASQIRRARSTMSSKPGSGAVSHWFSSRVPPRMQSRLRGCT